MKARAFLSFERIGRIDGLSEQREGVGKRLHNRGAH